MATQPTTSYWRHAVRGLTIGRLLIMAQAFAIYVVLFLIKPDGESTYNLFVLALLMLVTGLTVVLTGVTTSLEKEREEEKMRLAAAILRIVQTSLPVLRDGLSPQSAQRVVDILHARLSFDAVAICDNSTVLAFRGVSSDHHVSGCRILEPTRQAQRWPDVTVIQSRTETGCSESNCQLGSGLVVPLIMDNEGIGTINFYHVSEYAVTEQELVLGAGLSQLLSSQIELSAVKAQRELVLEAQIDGLKAQIRPHFIFNVLNGIASASLVDPGSARDMAIKLGQLLRRTFRVKTRLVSLDAELELVRQYVDIEMMRFPGLIEYNEQVERQAGNALVPLFLLQPLVENCIRHGRRDNKAHINVSASTIDSQLMLQVEDDGPGVDEESMKLMLGEQESSGVGVRNTLGRLKAYYGDAASFVAVNTSPGLRIVIGLPLEYEPGVETERIEDA